MPARPRVVALGDSVIAGYGTGGRSYVDEIAGRLDADRVMSYARSTFTVLDAVRMLDRVQRFEPDLALVNLGGSDGLVHAGEAVENLLARFAPKSWRGVEGLEPKPRGRAATKIGELRQQATGLAKLVLKHIGVRLTGGYRRVTPDRFEPEFETVVRTLTEAGVFVVVVGLHTPDERLWPRSTASGHEYEAATQRVLTRYPDAVFVDPRPVLLRWDDFLVDHAHFSETGHHKVADLIWAALQPHLAPSEPGGAAPTASAS
ncbi:SGNH/GDSL hydrolase family protein [Jatrophihabitans sp. YIM 134969]